jgi:hypothetical protein
LRDGCAGVAYGLAADLTTRETDGCLLEARR